MSYPRVLVAQLGARKHYQEPLLFHQWGMLETLYTDFYAGSNYITKLLRQSSLYHHLPGILRKGLDRYAPGLDAASVKHFPVIAYQYNQNLKTVSPQQTAKVYVQTNQEFCRQILRHGFGQATVIYGFNGASLELFKAAKAQGIRCILDQTLAELSLTYQLLQEEESRWLNWSVEPFKVKPYDLELLQREQQEQTLADHIICGSEFVKNSLIASGIAPEKISVVRLGGCQESIVNLRKMSSKRLPNTPINILFAGSVGLRKGIPYLLKALRQIQGDIPFSCKVVGKPEISSYKFDDFRDIVEFVGAVPRSKMSNLYKWADVFVLPSICEGSAMVTYEAMSYGVPIITTYNTGSIVRDGIDGWIVPIRDSQAIAQKLVKIFQDPLLSIHADYELEGTIDSYIRKVHHDSETTLRETLISLRRSSINY